MALVPQTLKQQLKTALSTIHCDPDNADGAIDAFCDALSQCIDTYVRSAVVTVNPGIPVETAGSPTAQKGATTGQGIGSLS